jgi:predicted permease
MAEEAHSTWIAQWMDDARRDLKHALRGMRRDTGFATFVILILGLGIGACSTVFSVVNALLLRPLPFRDADRLVWIANEEWSTQVGIHLYLRERNHSFSDLAGFAFYGVGDSALTGTGEPERLTSVPVTQNFFTLLGVQPTIGRSFLPEECRGKFNNPPAALLSYGLWQRRFAKDPAMVGRTLTLNNKPVTVVGVLPASFDFASVFAPGTPVDVFIPWPLTDETNRYGNTMKQIGRLKPGATAQSAQAEFTLLAEQVRNEHPEWNGIKPRLSPLSRHVSGRVSAALITLACAVEIVMLIVCANLSNLQLARLGSRQKEMAMRAALGAGRLRLLRQMLTESVALACCGAVPGLVLAVAGTRAIAHLDAFDIPLLASVRLDGDALVFTLLAAVLTGVLFGLLPALQVRSFAAQSGSISHALKDGSHGTSGRTRTWVRHGLVVSEIVVCLHLTGGRGTADAELSGRSGRESGISTGRGGCPPGKPEFSLFGFGAAELLYRRGATADARGSRHPGSRSGRISAAGRGSRVAGLRQGTDLPKGPPSRGLRLGSERRILRVPRDPFAGRKSIHGEGSRIERTGCDRQ